MVSRTERTPFAHWWWTVDRLMLAAIGVLILAGIILLLAASPPVAVKLGLDPFHFVNRQGLYLVPAIAILLGTSYLSPRQMRRIALVVFVVSVMMLAATLHFGAEVKGARRWIVLLGVNIQPSEFVKPAFVILIAWLFAESSRKPEMPANSVAMGLLLLVITLLVLQPDFGQTMLIALVWGALFFMAGMRLIWVAGLFGAAAIGLTGAYFTVPHVAKRFKRFFDPSSGDTFQIDNAVESFVRGGWFGRGPGEGTVKRILAGQSCRLRLRGRGGGIRHRAVSCAGRAVRLHRDPRADRARCATTIRSCALRRRVSPSCSARNRRSTWRSICISFRPRA